MGLAALSGCNSITGVLFLSLEAFFSARSNNIYLSRNAYNRAVIGVTVSWLFHLVFIIGGILTSVPEVNVMVCYFGNPFYDKRYLTAFSTMVLVHLPIVLGLQVSIPQFGKTKVQCTVGMRSDVFPLTSIVNKSCDAECCVNNMLQIIQNMMVSQG